MPGGRRFHFERLSDWGGKLLLVCIRIKPPRSLASLRGRRFQFQKWCRRTIGWEGRNISICCPRHCREVPQAVLALPKVKRLLSTDHFSVDCMLIVALLGSSESCSLIELDAQPS